MRRVINIDIRKRKVKTLIMRTKFLRDEKYYKNNILSVASWDSWAAIGQGEGCDCCGSKSYNVSLENKRHSRRVYVGNLSHCYKIGKSSWQGNSILNLCHHCISQIERIINYKFKRR